AKLFVDRGLAARHRGRRHCGHAAREAVARPEEPARAAQHPGQDDPEAPVRVEGLAPREIAALHPLGEPHQRLTRHARELRDPRELIRRRRLMPHVRLDGMSRSPFFDGWKSCPRCTTDLEIVEAKATCPACGLIVYANPGPTVSALVLDDDGRILLARRAADPGRGLWDLLGGFADEGETPF